MTDTASRMLCPTCEEQPLETLKIAQGVLQRCTSCLYFWIELKTLAALSDDRTKFLALIEESKSLLLPTARFCPVCYQKLHHGRIKSRQLILTICPVCQALWIDFPTLNQLDAELERTLKTALEYGPLPSTTSPEKETGDAERKTRLPSADDKGMGKLFRGVANVFDKMADRASSDTPAPAKPTPEKKKPAPATPKKTEKAKPVVPTPAEPPEVPAEEPPVVETVEAASVETPVVEPAPVPSVQPVAPPPVVHEPVAPPPVPVVKPPVEPPPVEPLPELRVEPMPTFSPPVEPPPTPAPVEPPAEIVLEPMPTVPPPAKAQPVEPPREKKELILEPIATTPPPEPKPSDEDVRRALMEQTAPKPKGVEDKSKKKSEPVSPKLPTKMPPPVGSSPTPRSGLGGKIAAFFKPSKSRPKPVAAPPLAKTPAVEPPKKVEPLPEKPKIETPPPVVPNEPKVPEPIVVKPEPPLPEKQKVVEPPVVPVEPKIPEPVAVKAEPPPKPAPKVQTPKVPKVRTPSIPMVDRAAGWLPRLLPIIVFLLNLTKGPDFDMGEAIVWVLLAWAGALVIRLVRTYPFKPFIDTTVSDLRSRTGLSRWRGIPVQLKGRLTEGPIVSFVDDTGEIALNQYGKMELIPRFFGISGIEKLPKDEVVIQGWLRGTPAPFVDIGHIQAGKVSRKALVRGLRWALAVVVILISSLVLLSD